MSLCGKILFPLTNVNHSNNKHEQYDEGWKEQQNILLNQQT